MCLFIPYLYESYFNILKIIFWQFGGPYHKEPQMDDGYQVKSRKSGLFVFLFLFRAVCKLKSVF